MKLYKSITVFSVLLFTVFHFGFAQGKKEESLTVKVWGNCGMCKKLIEKTALANGATTASWSSETKMLDLKFPAGKATSDKIQQAIANTGYDTEKYTANQAAYDNLHECCKYERKAAGPNTNASAMNTGHGNHQSMNHASCQMKDGKCMGDKQCCKKGECNEGCCKDCSCKGDKACCKKGECNEGCCKDGKCVKGKGECKDAANCKEKGCCKA